MQSNVSFVSLAAAAVKMSLGCFPIAEPSRHVIIYLDSGSTANISVTAKKIFVNDAVLYESSIFTMYVPALQHCTQCTSTYARMILLLID